MAHDVNLDEMSRDELVKLEKDVQKALKSYDQRKRTEAMAAAKEAAKEHGFALDELLQDTPTSQRVFRNTQTPKIPPTHGLAGDVNRSGWKRNSLRDIARTNS